MALSDVTRVGPSLYDDGLNGCIGGGRGTKIRVWMLEWNHFGNDQLRAVLVTQSIRFVGVQVLNTAE